MKTRITLLVIFSLSLAAILLNSSAYSQRPPGDLHERFQTMSARAEAEGLAEAFTGVVTSDGKAEGLFPIRKSGVSTDPVRQAATAFLSALTAEQRGKTVFPVDDPEWRKWMNQHFYIRQGVSFEEMNEAQRESAFALLRASLSAKGFDLSRDIMRLNHTLGELNDDNFVEYGEWLYWITIMGEPSQDKPWGWQIDGHHLIVNYFVLGDQVVMTPLFVGSEPVVAESGKYKGVAILQDEQNRGLELIQSLTASQRDQAIIKVSKTENDNVGEAFKDNVVLDYAGAPVSEFSGEQRKKLLDLMGLYVDNMDEGHARVRMEEVEKSLDKTWFAWVGGTDSDAVYYYRIHSPVILIEFDHQRPVGIRQYYQSRLPIRQHVHCVVRTPNGNDYGKDLLRQHYERYPHNAD